MGMNLDKNSSDLDKSKLEDSEITTNKKEDQNDNNNSEIITENNNSEQKNKDSESTEIKKLKEKIESLEDQLKRTQADFVNYKKRVIKDNEIHETNIISKVLSDFLIFKQTLEKAKELEKNQDSKNNLTELEKNFDNILEKQGLKKIDVLNKDFDYNTSECIHKQKVKDKSKNNKVIEVFENAYTYKNKLIKPAKVIVGELEE